MVIMTRHTPFSRKKRGNAKLVRTVALVVCFSGVIAFLVTRVSRGEEATITNRGWGTRSLLVADASRGQGATSGGGQQAQQLGQQAAIKADVRIVLVDVVVTGAKGAAASGLKKEDFQISEDGKAADAFRFLRSIRAGR